MNVEKDQESFGGHDYEIVIFTDIPSLLDGSGDLYFVRDKLPYLTIMQQGDQRFREALMIADVRQRGRR